MGWIRFTIVIMAITGQLVLAGCSITAGDWTKVLTGLNTPNSFGFFNSSGDCIPAPNSTTSLRALYGDCTTDLQTVLSTQGLTSNCRTNVTAALYTGNGVLDQPKAIQQSINICAESLGAFVTTYLCDPTSVPGCINFATVGKNAAIVNCFAVPNLTLSQRTALFTSGGDITCLRTNGFCDQYAGFQTCLPSVNDIINFLYANKLYTCPGLFLGAPDVDARCSQSLSSMYYYYCPKQSWLQQNTIPLAVGIPAGVVFLALFIWCGFKIRSGFISDHDVISGLDDTSPGMQKQRTSTEANIPALSVHPELAAVMEKKSKFKGITFDVNTRKWRSNATGMLFPTEMEAAQAAYLAQVNNAPRLLRPLLAQKSSPKLSQQQSSSFSNSSPVAAYIEPEFVVESDEDKKQRRIRQLVNFYEYWDSDRPNIPDHVENLIRRHDFTFVARAVKTKYGLLPPGWEEELEAEAT